LVQRTRERAARLGEGKRFSQTTEGGRLDEDHILKKAFLLLLAYAAR